MNHAKEVAEKVFRAAIRDADPYLAVRRHGDEIRSIYREGGFAQLIVIGFGKASISMAKGMEDSLGDLIDAGLIITKYGHGTSRELRKIRFLEGGHPVPDADGATGTEEIINLVTAATEKTLVVTLISGGGSALLVSPCAGITLAEKQETTGLLLAAGAGIFELNCVRKHLSRVKGGRLAAMIRPARSVSLILSDVIGDRLDVIASGPTAPDPTTFADALDVLERYRLLKRVPTEVVAHLTKGREGEFAETLKEGDPVFRTVQNVIVGSNCTALEAAAREAEALGFGVEILSAGITGEAREAGRWLAHKAVATRSGIGGGGPFCLISGGETTVTVKGGGKGGRNMELALAFALEIEGISGITLLSAGTDGTDGPTDAAGAVVDGTTATMAKARGFDPEEYLRNNDSYSFFRECGGLLVTGPTGTNVMDIQIVVIE
ncbi:MAG: hydroxypyruvate [Geobacteraceae bacterium]|nr:MAG: hydroxypyruvate [Geobacteraceae bacterium]